jgi:hypothetical protein
VIAVWQPSTGVKLEPQLSATLIASLYCSTSVDGLADFTVDTNPGITITEANFGSELVGHDMLGQRNTDVPGTATSVAADAGSEITTTTTASAAMEATRSLIRATGTIRVSFSFVRSLDTDASGSSGG